MMISVSRMSLVAVGFLGAVALAHFGCSDDNINVNSGLDALSGGGGTGGTGTGGTGTGGTSTGGTGGTGTGGGGSTGTSSLDGGATATGDGGVRLSDSATAGVMMEANGGEVMVGTLATNRAQDARVRSFAQQMVTEHSMANTRLNTLLQQKGLTAGDSEVRRMLAMAAQTTLNQLSNLSAAAFDAAYMASQVDMHQQVLKLLDDVLIPSAEDADLKAELVSARATVAMHLTAAQTLAASVAGTDGGAPDASADGP
jgi:predicted outer membrane protein